MSVQLLVGERKEGESDKAAIALNDYLRMGAGRSLEKLYQSYTETTLERPPSANLRWLKEWSRLYGWQERASAYDALMDIAKTEEINRLRTEGLATDYERIRELTKLFDMLRAELEEKGLWYIDTKISSKGDTVDVEVFNTGLLSQFRGVLDDIAKETGGRKTEVKHGGDITITVRREKSRNHSAGTAPGARAGYRRGTTIQCLEYGEKMG